MISQKNMMLSSFLLSEKKPAKKFHLVDGLLQFQRRLHRLQRRPPLVLVGLGYVLKHEGETKLFFLSTERSSVATEPTQKSPIWRKFHQKLCAWPAGRSFPRACSGIPWTSARAPAPRRSSSWRTWRSPSGPRRPSRRSNPGGGGGWKGKMKPMKHVGVWLLSCTMER